MPASPASYARKLSIKRACPTNSVLDGPSFSQLVASTPCVKWDVDGWRRGKRARKESAVIIDGGLPSGAPYPPMPRLPSTSAAFDLFPKRRQHQSKAYCRPTRRGSSPIPYSDHAGSDDDAQLAMVELRSAAFGELQRCVAESGEGLVSRMRDWEESRPPCAGPRTGRSLSVASAPVHHIGMQHEEDDDDEDDDDVQFVGEVPLDDVATSKSTEDVRAPSPDAMDTDDDFSGPIGDDASACHRISDSLYPHSSSSSEPGFVPCTPMLSYTRNTSHTSSLNSSLASLPLDPLTSAPPPPKFAHDPFTGLPLAAKVPYRRPTPPHSTRTDKAIAALSLALANGGAGINDYAALRLAAGPPPMTELAQAEVGGMWD